MSKRAEEKSIAYQLATHGPRVMGGSAILSEDDYKFWNINYDFKAGYEEAEKDLGWHPASEHPPVDEVVIVLSNVLHDGTVLPDCRICFGHIVNTDTTVEVHGNPYKVESYNGWNIPGVVWWMPMPKIPEEEEK